MKNAELRTRYCWPLSSVSTRAAFTLIELLIVVLIIAILAAIAVPNFLEFQTRAKVSRSATDMRSIATALEAYATDNAAYPFVGNITDFTLKLAPLTTPISYLSTVPKQAFKEYMSFGATAGSKVYYYQDRATCDWLYVQFPSFGNSWPYYEPVNIDIHHWYLSSVGPDSDYDQGWFGAGSNHQLYDPTNGTVTNGDIIRMGP
ncbi:prepilin-type N-terminal cleavage/methylation domain-containing protein [Candidatus Sumerlaeota bacterium]